MGFEAWSLRGQMQTQRWPASCELRVGCVTSVSFRRMVQKIARAENRKPTRH